MDVDHVGKMLCVDYFPEGNLNITAVYLYIYVFPGIRDAGKDFICQSFDSFITSLKMDPRFYRCNRGVVINLEHAVDFDGTGFRLDNGSNVPVSRKLLKNARQTFMEFLFQRRS